MIKISSSKIMNKTQPVQIKEVKEVQIKEVKEVKEVHENKKDMKKKNQKDYDSSDVSSDDDNYDNMTSDEISQKGKEKFFKTELMEKIIKYIKIDDSIKEKQKEIREQVKCLKTQKEDMEKYILSYLENINEDYVNIEGAAKLTKTTSISKGAIKPDNIKVSVLDGLKKQNINLDDKKIGELLENVIESIDKNRPTKTRTYIKRTKGKVNKSLRKIAEENEGSGSGDDDIPKYSSDKGNKVKK
jgi:hypothetical protein